MPIDPITTFDLTDQVVDALSTERAAVRSLKELQADQPLQAVPEDRRKLEEAARAFESFFIASLLKEMRKTIPKSDLFGQGPGQELYQSLFDDALGQALVDHGGLGLTRQILLQNFKKGLLADQESGKISR